MAKGKTDESPSAEGNDLMAVVEATDPSLMAPPEPPPAEAAPDKMTEAPVAPPPPPAPAGRSGAGAFLGMVLGGVLAAGAGFGLARFMPDMLPIGGDDALSATVAAQADEIAALRAELAALKEQVAALGSGGSVPADVIAAADAAEARLKAAEASATAMAEQAEAAAAAARRGAALDRVTAALDSGAPYASALPELGGADLPPVLLDNAAVGLPTVADLAESFPEAARTGLEAALRANMGESWTDRVSSFLRSQTGLRSLTPREGNDPDAVLSRAEAALAQGRVADAITELAAMPEAGKPALADWLAQAQTRVDAEAAVAALAAN